jgi:hypothetical protein
MPIEQQTPLRLLSTSGPLPHLMHNPALSALPKPKMQPNNPLHGMQLIKSFIMLRLAKREREAAAAAKRPGAPPVHMWLDEVVPGFQVRSNHKRTVILLARGCAC